MQICSLLVCTFLLISFITGCNSGSDFSFENQAKLAEIFNSISSGLGPVDNEKHPFPYDSKDLYQDEDALENFLKAYKRGFSDKHGTSTVNSLKIRSDTKAVFDLLYFAKDFDIFYKVCKWALNELNRMEFGLAFVASAMHREDTRHLYMPPLYEILPDYFVPASVMYKANVAKILGHESQIFLVNNTGYEWTWYLEATNGPTKESLRWNGDDVNSRLSYFREDVGLAHTLTNIWMKFGGCLDSDRYQIKFNRASEQIYNYFRFILIRYNMERLSNGLPPVEPLDHDTPIEDGYYAGLADLAGCKLASRPNGIVPAKINPRGIQKVKESESRINDVVDSGEMRDRTSKGMLEVEGNDGLSVLSALVFGRSSALFQCCLLSDYYKPLFFSIMSAYDSMMKSSSHQQCNPGTLGSLMTAFRDPIFYRIIATIMRPFDRYLSNLPPYTKEMIDFPQVHIKDFTISEMMTTFDRHEFSLNNGVEGADWDQTNMAASQLRLNLKQFTYNIKVNAELDLDVAVKLFIGPKLDSLGRLMPIDEARKLFYIVDFYSLKLFAGVNVIKRNSSQMETWSDTVNYRSFREKETNAKDSKSALNPPQTACKPARNLMLPRGWKQGKELQLFVTIIRVSEREYGEGYFPCDHNLQLHSDASHLSPFDRNIPDKDILNASNMFLKDVTIFNEF